MSAFEEAAERIRVWREKPQVMVRELFGVTPDPWQDEVLAAFPSKPRIAMKACKGPGKTALLSWLAWNFLLTRPHPKIAATSITADNLADNLWAEMAKWQMRSELLKAAFEWTKTRIFARQHSETWWMSARTWPKGGDPNQQADTLAGLHGDYILIILDESGGIPMAVMATADAALASCIEGHIVQAGNPTHLSGPLYAACTNERALWFLVEITGDPDDPKRSSRISVQWAKEQIEKYGRDNPWVLVNVFGRFPPSSLNQLIGPDEVRAAMDRHYNESQFGHAARIIGVDVARFGDDASVIARRQGLVALPFIAMRNVDSNQGAGRVAREWSDWQADAAMIDGTGGFGAGWIDALKLMGRTPFNVQFAGEPNDPRFYNKRAEILWTATDWVKNGGALPNCPELLADMTAHSYSFKGDRILIEPKESVKERLQRSPDWFDALGCTFAFPVVRKPGSHLELLLGGARQSPPAEYDPYANMT